MTISKNKTNKKTITFYVYFIVKSYSTICLVLLDNDNDDPTHTQKQLDTRYGLDEPWLIGQPWDLVEDD